MKQKFAFLTFAIFQTVCSFATHLRGGEIQIKQQANSLTVTIRVLVFTNTESTTVLFGGDDDILDFGDNSDPDNDGRVGIMIPETMNTPAPWLGDNIAFAYFTIDHTYANEGDYVISYSEPNRNENLVNLDESVNTRFYLESGFNLLINGHYTSPQALNEPIVFVPGGKMMLTSFACVDLNDYLLQYEKVVPKRSADQEVVNYKFPENYKLGQNTGLAMWDTKFNGSVVEGEFLFTVKVSQKNSSGDVVGYIIRDLQVVVDETTVSFGGIELPQLNDENELHLEPNQSARLKVVAESLYPESDTLFFSSELMDLPENYAVQTYDSVADSGVFIVGILTLKNTEAIQRENPYNIVVSYSQNGSYRVDANYLLFAPSDSMPDVVTKNETDLTNIIHVYPNPFHDYFHLSRAVNRESVSIFDSQGNEVDFEKNQCDFDLRHLANGFYFLKISLPGKQVVHKVFKH